MKLSIQKIVLLVLMSFGGQLIAQKQQSNQETKVTVTSAYLEIEYGIDNEWMKAKQVSPNTYQFILNNNEGKFESFQVVADEFPFDLISNEMNKNEEMTMSLLIEVYENFIEQVIHNILRKEKEYNSIRFYTQSTNDRTNADNDDWYRSDRNKLIYYVNIKDKLEIQLGKSVETDLKKTYISELDRTVFNSLNLLALNY